MIISTNPEHIEGDPLDRGHGDEDVGRLRRVDQPVANHHHLQTWAVLVRLPNPLAFGKEVMWGTWLGWSLRLSDFTWWLTIIAMSTVIKVIKWSPLEGDIRRQHSWPSPVDGWRLAQTGGWKLDNFRRQTVLIEMEMNHQIRNEPALTWQGDFVSSFWSGSWSCYRSWSWSWSTSL